LPALYFFMDEEFQLISLWLAGNRDFQSGVQIYNRLGNDFMLMTMFEQGYTAYREEQLIEAMNDLLLLIGKSENPVATNETIIHEAALYVANVENHGIRASMLPNAPLKVREAVKMRRNLYYEFMRLHTMLVEQTPRKTRTEYALRILDIFDELKPLWDLTNFYDQYLRLPDEQKVIDIDSLTIVEANKRYDANYKYVRKFYEDDKKRENVLRRIEESAHLKTRLINENAFFHERLTFPTIAT
jgi:hypothetical protein